MKRILSYILIGVALLAATAACSRHRHDARLERVYALSDSLPGEALAALDSIDPAALHGSDIPFYNLLRVKTADKNYRDISADSFITGVIEHFEDFGDARLHAEALYYGGRVSNDAGDFPTAIRYYQDALDILPDNDANLHLRGCILSQTARLLKNLMLYREAIPYLSKTIEIDRIEGDTFNLVFDYIMFSEIYSELNRFSESDSILLEARRLSANIPESDRAYINKELAWNRLNCGDITEALNYIRGVPESIDSIDKNSAVVDAALIYLGNGMTDTAYVCADYLVRQDKISDRRIGYYVLLAKPMRKYSSQDSLDSYLDKFITLTNAHFKRHESQAAIMQQTYYNYSAHERAKIAAENSAKRTQAWLYGISFIALGLIVIVLIVKYRSKSILLCLHKEISALKVINDNLSKAKTDEFDIQESQPIITQENKFALRERKRAELFEIYQKTKEKKIDPAIKRSDTYAKLHEYIINEKLISADNPLWEEIEVCVHNVSPGFKSNLQLLSGWRIKTSEYRTALLIKCGVTPTEMKVLLGLEKGSISSRRESLGMKIFDEKMSVRYVDGIILAL